MKAKDEAGLESYWSDPLSISMPKNKESINSQDNSNPVEGFGTLTTFKRMK